MDSNFLDFMVDDDIQIIKDDRHPAIKELIRHQEKIAKIINRVEILIIYDKESADIALRLSVESKEIFEDMESFRKKTLEPYRKFISCINECASNLKKSLEYIDATIKIKIAGWHEVQHRQALEAIETTNEFTESLGLQIPIVIRKATKNTSCESATAYTRDKVTFEIEDASIIPDEYWVIDEKAIQKHIDLGKKDIPGVNIKTEKVMTIRRK